MSRGMSDCCMLSEVAELGLLDINPDDCPLPGEFKSSVAYAALMDVYELTEDIEFALSDKSSAIDND